MGQAIASEGTGKMLKPIAKTQPDLSGLLKGCIKVGKVEKFYKYQIAIVETLPRMIKSGILVVHISSVVGFSV